MSANVMWRVVITAQEKAELQGEPGERPLGEKEIRGHTLYSLISAGTELNGMYLGAYGKFPAYPGYAAVFQVEEVGSEVRGARLGELRLCMGPHQSRQQLDAAWTLPVPKCLAPESATLARMMGITMTTLVTTQARPGDIVLVTGLGPVGFLAAQMFTACGYQVLACDPDKKRRALAIKAGLETVMEKVPLEDTLLRGRVALAVECAGHEQAVLSACRLLRKHGELVLVGVPWQRRTEIYAQTLLWEIFDKYIVLRSGWEWELPLFADDFRPHSIFSNLALAMQWLSRGRINVHDTYAFADPRRAQDVYQVLLHNRAPALSMIFDWRKVAPAVVPVKAAQRNRKKRIGGSHAV